MIGFTRWAALWVSSPVILTAATVLTHQPNPLPPPKKAIENISDRLFRIECTAPGRLQRGTAYLLNVTKENGTWMAYYATCYHVVRSTNEASVFPADVNARNAVAKFGGKQTGLVWVRPQLDLVILRAPAATMKELASPRSLAEDRISDGYVFGFPPFGSDDPLPVQVRLGKDSQDASGSYYRTDLGDPRMKVRVLGNEITFPGMSGGPVIDDNGQYAGMLLGRMPEPAAIPVFLTVNQIREQLETAMKENAWKPFGPDSFTAPLPYRQDKKLDFGQYLTAPYLVSEQDWSGFDGWTQTLGTDPTPFLREFQEASAPLDFLRAATKTQPSDPVTFAINPASRPDDNHTVEFRWNGRLLSEKERAELRPGENLLIVSKRFEAGGIVLNDLFRPNTLDVELQINNTTAFRIKRSVPSLVRRYAIFVTIHNGSIEADAMKDSYSARLAVRLDYLNALMNRVPFAYPLQGRDPATNSSYDAVASTAGDYLKLQYVSPQTLDASLTSSIAINKLDLRFGGIKATYPPKDKQGQKYTLTMSGRVQFPAELPIANKKPVDPALFFVSARALGASSPDEFRLPFLGNEVDVDVGAIVREALVCYVNKELLIPERAAVPGPEKLHQLLEQAGVLSALNGHTLKPVRAFLTLEDPGVRDKSENTWVVITFRLVAPDGREVIAEQKPKFLPEEKHRSKLGIEFLAHGLPLAAGKVHFAKPDPMKPREEAKVVNRLSQELVAQQNGLGVMADRMRIGVEPDKQPPRAMPITPDGKAELLSKAVGDILRESFTEAPKTLEADLAPDSLLQLLASLPAGKDLLTAERKVAGALTLTGTIGGPRPQLTLKNGRQAIQIHWPKSVALAKDITATNLAVTLKVVTVTGELGAERFTGRIEGEWSADEIVFGKGKIVKPKCTFVADIDSKAPKNTEQVRLCLTGEQGNYTDDANNAVALKGKVLKLAVGMGTSATDLPEVLIKMIIDTLFLQKC